MPNITVRKLTTVTIYKLVFLGLLFGFLPLSLLLGILGYFNLASVTWNGQAVYGVSALYIVPLILFLVAIVWSLLAGSIMAMGLWIYAKFKPIRLDFYASAAAEKRETNSFLQSNK